MHREALAMYKNSLGSERPEVAKSLNNVALELVQQGKLAEAEGLLRECLAIREKKALYVWRKHRTQARLGACLLAQKKFAEAEPLLLSGYEGLSQDESSIPPIARSSVTNAAECLAQYYEQTGQPDKAARFKAKPR